MLQVELRVRRVSNIHKSASTCFVLPEAFSPLGAFRMTSNRRLSNFLNATATILIRIWLYRSLMILSLLPGWPVA
eukprot:6208633-Pleurochrysis_carterae.AAC.3